MPFYPDEVAVTRLPVPAHVARKRRQRNRRIATVAVVLAFALVGFFAARSWAHTIDVATQEICVDGKTYVDVTVNSQRGDYRFAGTATDGEGHSVAVGIPAGGASTTVRLGPVTSAGSVRVVGDFWKANGDKAEHMDRSVRYRPLNGCKPPPPVSQGTVGVSTTCDSVTFNFGGADVGVEQYAKVDGKEQRPASRNGSVTFKGLTPGEHPVEYGSGKNVQRGSFEALDCTPDTPKGDDTGDSSTSQSRTQPPDTPEEVAPPVIKTPGTLPFTGPREDMQRAMLLGGLALVLAGVALLVTLRRKPAVVVEQGWGETRVRPDRDSADANLLATLFSRRDR